MKFSIALNLVLATVLGILVIKQYWPPKTPKISCKDPCTQYFLSGVTQPSSSTMISYQTAERMSAAYHQDKGKSYINGDTSRPDALSITFPMQQLKNFVWYAEQLICEHNCTRLQLGAKVYYGIYPKETGIPGTSWDLEGLRREDADRHSIFFVPVIRENASQDWRVVDLKIPGPNCEYPVVVSPTDSLKPYAYLIAAPPSGPEDADNHGGLRPPPYDVGPLTFPR